MKRVLTIMFIILSLLITGCSKNDDIIYMGVNAEILEISHYVKGIVVKGLDNDSFLGDGCYINCESEDVYFIYVDNIGVCQASCRI